MTDNMADFKNLNLADLCSVLGFERDHPTRDSHAFLHSTKTYLDEYEASGNRVPPNETADPREAQVCACTFLLKDDRASKVWPENSGNGPIWPKDQSMITMAVARIFRRQAFYNYQRRLKLEKNEGSAKRGRSGRKMIKKRTASLPPPNEQSSDSEDNSLGVDPQFSLTPWTQPAKRLSRRICAQYLRSINPRHKEDWQTGITAEWLATPGARWPDSADTHLQILMHQKDFYFCVDLKDDTVRAHIKQLRAGTELQCDIGISQYRSFRDRVLDRVDYYTKQFTKNRFLEYGIDGTPKKTKRFEHFWNTCEDYWQEGRSEVGDGSPKNRRKSKSSKIQLSDHPVSFPNLSNSSDEISVSELALLANSALGVAAQREKEETHALTAYKASSPQLQTSIDLVSGQTVSPPSGSVLSSIEIDMSDGERIHSSGRVSPDPPLITKPSIQEQKLSPNGLVSHTPTSKQLAEVNQGLNYLVAAHTTQDKSNPNSCIRPGESLPNPVDKDNSESSSILGNEAAIASEASPTSHKSPIVGDFAAKNQRETSHLQRIHTKSRSPMTLGEYIRKLNLQRSSMSRTPPASHPEDLGPGSSRTAPSGTSAVRASSPQSPSALPLFPHDARAQYERDLKDYRKRQESGDYPAVSTAISPVSQTLPESSSMESQGSGGLGIDGSLSQTQHHSWSSRVFPASSGSPVVQNFPTNIGSRRESAPEYSIAPAYSTTPDIRAMQSNPPQTLNNPIPTTQFSPVNVTPMAPPPNTLPQKRSASTSQTPGFSSPRKQIYREHHRQNSQQETFQIPLTTSIPNAPLLRAPDYHLKATTQAMSQFETSPLNSSHQFYPPPATNSQFSQQPVQYPPPSQPVPSYPPRQHQFPPNEASSNPQGPSIEQQYHPRFKYFTGNQPLSGTPYFHNQNQFQEQNPSLRAQSPQALPQYQSHPLPMPGSPYRFPQSQYSYQPPPPKFPSPQELAAAQSQQPPADSRRSSSTQSGMSGSFIAVSSPFKLPSTPKRLSLENKSDPSEPEDKPHAPSREPNEEPSAGSLESPSAIHLDALRFIPFSQSASQTNALQRSADKRRHRQQILPSPPQASPRTFSDTSSLEQRLSDASAQPIPVAKDRSTPSRTPSPVQLPTPGRRPYSFVPDRGSWSSMPETEPVSESQENALSGPAVPLSTDTRLSTYSQPSSEPKQRLELVLQHADKSLDFDNPLSSEVLKESSISEFYKIYAEKTGTPLASLTTLTFTACFGDHQELVVGRYAGEKPWEKLKKRLDNLVYLEQKTNPEETEFEVWVKPGEAARSRSSSRQPGSNVL